MLRAPTHSLLSLSVFPQGQLSEQPQYMTCFDSTEMVFVMGEIVLSLQHIDTFNVAPLQHYTLTTLPSGS